MMKKICILVVAVCMVLSACSNKTNNVKFSEFDSEYVPVNEITDTYSKALKLEYAHFTIRDSVRISDVSSVSRTLYKPSDGFLFNKEQRFIDYLNGSPVDLSKISVSSDDMGGYHQLNAEGGYPYFTDYDGGSIVWIKDEDAEAFFLTNENITVKRYYCCNTFDDEKYKLKDCEMSISEAIEKSAEFSEGLRKIGYPQMSPFEIRVEKINDTYAFRIDMVQQDNGVPLRAANSGFEGRESSVNDVFTGRLSKINSNPAGYTVLITSSSDIGCFRNNENVFCEYEKENIDKVITPYSALRYIDDNLSDNSSYEVDYIGLENKIYWVDAETGVYSSTPMWTVSLYSPTEEKLYYALVGCETGDFSFYSQSRGDINL